MIRRSYRAFLLLLIFYFAFTFSSHARDYPFIGVITESNVNLRAGYNKNFKAIKQLKKDDKVVVLDKYYDWYKVRLPDDAHCFVAKQYISRDGIVLVNRLNVRAGPGANFNVLGKLDRNSKVIILEKKDNWYRIKAPSHCVGWIYEPFVVYYSEYGKIGVKLEEYTGEEKWFKLLTQFDLENLNSYTKDELNHILLTLKRFKDDFPSSKYEGAINEKIEKIEIYIVHRQKRLQTSAKKEKNYPFKSQGVIKDLGKVIGNPATHKLKVNGKTRYYLKSETLNLNNYVNRSVCVWGKENVSSKYPLIIVEKVEVIY